MSKLGICLIVVGVLLGAMSAFSPGLETGPLYAGLVVGAVGGALIHLERAFELSDARSLRGFLAVLRRRRGHSLSVARGRRPGL